MTARKITQNNSNLFEYWKENTCHWPNQCDQKTCYDEIKIFHASRNWRCSVFRRKAFQAIIVYIFRIFFLFCISPCQITSKYLMKLSILSNKKFSLHLWCNTNFLAVTGSVPPDNLTFLDFQHLPISLDCVHFAKLPQAPSQIVLTWNETNLAHYLTIKT